MRTARINKVQDLGEIDDFVYDIEVPNSHTFFANNILVHNTDSIFVKFDKVIKNIYKDKIDDVTEDEKIDKVIEMNERVSKYLNTIVLPEMLKRHNTSPETSEACKFNPNLKQELVIRRSIFVDAKKKYAIWIVRKEGKVMDDIASTGMEIVRSDYPKFTRDMMQDFINLILKMNANKSKIIAKLSDYKSKYNDYLDTWNLDAGIPGVWSNDIKDLDKLDSDVFDDESETQNDNSVPTRKCVVGMLVYNAIFGNEFTVSDRGYRFDLEPFTPSYFTGEAKKRLEALVNSNLLKKSKVLDCITIPANKTDFKCENLTIDRKAMLDFAIDKRLKHICDVYKINIEQYDPDDVGFI